MRHTYLVNQVIYWLIIHTRQHTPGVEVSERISWIHTRTLVNETHTQDTKTTIHLNKSLMGTKLIKVKLSTIRTQLKNTRMNVPRLVFPPLLDA